EVIQGMRVSANFLSLMKVAPVRGRDFRLEEEQPTVPRVAMLSYEYWQARFGGNDSVFNTQIVLNGKPHTVVGILPAQFSFPFAGKEVAVVTTVADEGSNLPERGAQVFRAFGRLKQGVSIAQAQADIATIAAVLAQQYPQSNRDSTAYLVSASETVVGRDVRK